MRVRLPSAANHRTIGLMGGSFDPAHSGHAHVIATALRVLQLDEVWVLVAAGNPLKKTQTPFADRLAGARQRLAGRRVRVTSLERDLKLTYTVDLLRRLNRLAPQARFVWIIGGDNLRDFHRWRKWQAIARLAPIAVIARPGASPRAGLSRFARQFSGARIPPADAATLARRKPPAWVYINAPLDAASSTAIRAQRQRIIPPPV